MSSISFQSLINFLRQQIEETTDGQSLFSTNTLGGNALVSFFLPKDELGIGIMNSSGSEYILSREECQKIIDRYSSLSALNRNRAIYYTDPEWPITPSRIFAPYLPALIKVFINSEESELSSSLDHKAAFLKRYNPNGTIETALNKAVGAALQHNRTYTNDVNPARRKQFREQWKQELLQINDRLGKEKFAFNSVLAEIENLSDVMNKQFGQIFIDQHPRYGGRGFRIAHAQKSISVFMKHLWCMDKIPEPPICPVDRRILILLGIDNEVMPWTAVDSIEVYLDQLNRIMAQAEKEGKNIAQWELESFQNF